MSQLSTYPQHKLALASTEAQARLGQCAWVYVQVEQKRRKNTSYCVSFLLTNLPNQQQNGPTINSDSVIRVKRASYRVIEQAEVCPVTENRKQMHRLTDPRTYTDRSIVYADRQGRGFHSSQWKFLYSLIKSNVVINDANIQLIRNFVHDGYCKVFWSP